MANNDSVVTMLDGVRGSLERLEAEQRRAKMGKSNGGEPPMDNGTLEDIDKRLTVVEATMATKADLSGLEARMAWRFVGLYGSITATMAALLALFKFLH